MRAARLADLRAQLARAQQQAATSPMFRAFAENRIQTLRQNIADWEARPSREQLGITGVPDRLLPPTLASNPTADTPATTTPPSGASWWDELKDKAKGAEIHFIPGTRVPIPTDERAAVETGNWLGELFGAGIRSSIAGARGAFSLSAGLSQDLITRATEGRRPTREERRDLAEDLENPYNPYRGPFTDEMLNRRG